jgi:hypothetical protein
MVVASLADGMFSFWLLDWWPLFSSILLPFGCVCSYYRDLENSIRSIKMRDSVALVPGSEAIPLTFVAKLSTIHLMSTHMVYREAQSRTSALPRDSYQYKHITHVLAA